MGTRCAHHHALSRRRRDWPWSCEPGLFAKNSRIIRARPFPLDALHCCCWRVRLIDLRPIRSRCCRPREQSLDLAIACTPGPVGRRHAEAVLGIQWCPGADENTKRARVPHGCGVSQAPDPFCRQNRFRQARVKGYEREEESGVGGFESRDNILRLQFRGTRSFLPALSRSWHAGTRDYKEERNQQSSPSFRAAHAFWRHCLPIPRLARGSPSARVQVQDIFFLAILHPHVTDLAILKPQHGK
jgi:hypothetical protein